MGRFDRDGAGDSGWGLSLDIFRPILRKNRYSRELDLFVKDGTGDARKVVVTIAIDQKLRDLELPDTDLLLRSSPKWKKCFDAISNWSRVRVEYFVDGFVNQWKKRSNEVASELSKTMLVGHGNEQRNRIIGHSDVALYATGSLEATVKAGHTEQGPIVISCQKMEQIWIIKAKPHGVMPTTTAQGSGVLMMSQKTCSQVQAWVHRILRSAASPMIQHLRVLSRCPGRMGGNLR